MPDFHTETSIGRFLRWFGVGRRLRVKRLARETLTLLFPAVIVAVVEVFGRWHALEVLDLASALTLGLTAAICTSWHRRLRLRWTRRTWRTAAAFARRFEGLRFQWGLDLRREPPAVRGIPPLLVVLVGLLAAGVLAASAWAMLVGTPMRDLAAGGSYVVYVAAAAGLWAGLLAVLVVAALVPVWTIFDVIPMHLARLKDHSRRLGWLLAVVYFGLLLAAAIALPTWIAVVLLGAGAALAAALPWMPRTWYPDCVWRSGSGGEVRSLSVGTLFSLQLAIVSLVPLALVTFALGPEALGAAQSFADWPISTSLGRAAAWFGCGGLWVFLGLVAIHMAIASRHDPSRPSPTSLHVGTMLDRQAQTRIRQQLAETGWTVRFAPARPARSDVRVALIGMTSEDETRSPSADAAAPAIALTIDELRAPPALERIARRDVVQRRRLLLKGLESIFRSAARRRRRGSGLWVAPHYWFVEGAVRDQLDDDSRAPGVIPPLYYQALPRAARRHCFEICRALAVDLIFVEDGVGFRGLRRVLRVMFERYDVDGGRQPLSEIHFAGLPKVRVILHDFDFRQPLTSSKYPEPSYRRLGRARVLHIYRDRGDEAAQDDVPQEPEHTFTPDDLPVLVG